MMENFFLILRCYVSTPDNSTFGRLFPTFKEHQISEFVDLLEFRSLRYLVRNQDIRGEFWRAIGMRFFSYWLGTIFL